MVRTQIQLTETQHRRLKRWAGRLGISLSEAVRRCIEDRLAMEGRDGGRDDLVREARAVFGKHVDPSSSDTARRHDDFLDEAYDP